MPRTAQVNLPLRNIREEAKVSVEDMAAVLTQKMGRRVSPEYVRTLESRGTRVYDYISVYAEVTRKPISLVAAAAQLR